MLFLILLGVCFLIKYFLKDLLFIVCKKWVLFSLLFRFYLLCIKFVVLKCFFLLLGVERVFVISCVIIINKNVINLMKILKFF